MEVDFTDLFKSYDDIFWSRESPNISMELKHVKKIKCKSSHMLACDTCNSIQNVFIIYNIYNSIQDIFLIDIDFHHIYMQIAVAPKVYNF